MMKIFSLHSTLPFEKYMNFIRLGLFAFFCSLGVLIGRYPLWTCVLSLVLCAACGSGVLFWRSGLSDLEMYMPEGSPVRVAADWVDKNFQDDLRYESVIVEAENVLEPDVLRAIQEVENDIKATRVDGKGWQDICARYSTWFEDKQEKSPGSKGNASSLGNLLENVPPEIQKSLQKAGLLRNDCIYQSPLKLWPNGLPGNLSRADVVRTITKALRTSSSVLTDVGSLFAGVQADSKGRILSAKVVILNWLLKKSESSAPSWEQEFIQRVLQKNRTLPRGVNIYAVATRSYHDMLDQVMDSNMTVLFAGFSLIILYVIVMLGRFNVLHQRIYLSLLGVSIVGQAILASYGLCFHLGFFFGPVHPILPFLLLGIGVDDMFVIVDGLDHVSKKHKHLDIPERIGKAMQNAGVSITVTSFTDIVAFAIGVTTRMPFLQSFCMFAAMGILFLFLFEITFFVGCLTMDEYRVGAKREGCCFIKLGNWKPNIFSQKNFTHTVFSKYIGPTLMRTPVKVFVILTTLVLVAFNAWCVLQIEQKFDPIWYLDSESYPIKFNNKLNQYFPKYGKRAGIYLAGVNYYTDAPKLNLLSQQLKENPYINQDTINIWYEAFQNWMKEKEYEPENEENYKGYLSEFLIFTKGGQEYIKDLKFSSFPFGEYNITATHIPIQYIMMNTTEQQLKAMSTVYNILHSMNLTNDQQGVAYSPDYIPWFTNKIIGEELLRNLGLTVVAVAVVTLVLIQEIQITLWVIVCVLFTLVDLVGSMYLFGLTIEISSSIMVLLCTGLTVDYAAHIGYEFSRMPGNGNERAILTLSNMGPAVFNGGFSTFLAFVLLGFSSSYIFTTFFKLFTSVVVFGCFHGMLFLPVMLSWLGPPPHLDAENHGDFSDVAGIEKSTTVTNGYYIPSKEGVELSIVHDNGQAAASQHLLTSSIGNHHQNHTNNHSEGGEATKMQPDQPEKW